MSAVWNLYVRKYVVYYATILIGCITGLARPSVSPSVRLSVLPFRYGLLVQKQKGIERPRLV